MKLSSEISNKRHYCFNNIAGCRRVIMNYIFVTCNYELYICYW